jgi:hypothetical protein
LKTTHQHFFQGPNLWSPLSGLLLIVEYGTENIQPTAWRPNDAEVESLLELLREVFPVVADSAELSVPHPICQGAMPVVELLLATTEVLIRDFYG